MTETKAETAPKPAKQLLALNPKQESEFKKKVQEAKKNKSSKVGSEEPWPCWHEAAVAPSPYTV